MSDRRDRIIEEMGLGPRWMLRAPSAESAPATAVPPSLEAAAPANHAAAPVANREAHIASLDWDGLQAAVHGCEACGLCKTRTQTVFGVGDQAAELLIVGEAPGAEEDRLGEPFVGQAGRLLDSMLAAVGMRRPANIYIANVLKCRPPGNRNPEPREVVQCSPHLARQITLVKPKLIVAMGRFAAQTLLASDASIASMRGKLFQYQSVPLIVTYHPAYLLRTLPDKAKAWEDLLFMQRTLTAA